jgi:hypothetical protein
MAAPGRQWWLPTLSGGYRLIEARDQAPGLSPHAPMVNIIATDSVVTEAASAVRQLQALSRRLLRADVRLRGRGSGVGA